MTFCFHGNSQTKEIDLAMLGTAPFQDETFDLSKLYVKLIQVSEEWDKLFRILVHIIFLNPWREICKKLNLEKNLKLCKGRSISMAKEGQID